MILPWQEDSNKTVNGEKKSMISSEESWKIKDFAFQLSSVPSSSYNHDFIGKAQEAFALSNRSTRSFRSSPVETFSQSKVMNLKLFDYYAWMLAIKKFLLFSSGELPSRIKQHQILALREFRLWTKTSPFFSSCKISRWLRLLTRSFVSFVIPLNKKEKYSKSFNILI